MNLRKITHAFSKIAKHDIGGARLQYVIPPNVDQGSLRQSKFRRLRDVEQAEGCTLHDGKERPSSNWNWIVPIPALTDSVLPTRQPVQPYSGLRLRSQACDLGIHGLGSDPTRLQRVAV